MDTESAHFKHILFVEEDPREVELAQAKLETRPPASRPAFVNNGAEALHFFLAWSQDGEAISRGIKEVKNEIPTQHPALGG